MATPTPVTLIGATGLTGSATLTALLNTKTHAFAITAIARKAIPTAHAANPQTTFSHKLSPDLFEAAKEEVATKGGVYISCLGTTRAKAGGLEAQEKLDRGLNRDLATKAKADGAETLILVSSGGASSASRFPYMKMKGALEDDVKALNFGSTIILQPGMLLGAREEHRTVEGILQTVFRGARSIGIPGVGSMSVEATDVGDCIAQLAATTPKSGVTVVSNNEIVSLAKQWREANTTEAK